jgi:hypothetical protein
MVMRRVAVQSGFVVVFPYSDKVGPLQFHLQRADRKDVIVMMEEQIKRFEGQPDISGTT